MSVRCPLCRGDRSRVIDKRTAGSGYRRRRECLNVKCMIDGKPTRWTTIEINVFKSRSALENELKVEYRNQILDQIREDLVTGIDTVLKTMRD